MTGALAMLHRLAYSSLHVLEVPADLSDHSPVVVEVNGSTASVPAEASTHVHFHEDRLLALKIPPNVETWNTIDNDLSTSAELPDTAKSLQSFLDEATPSRPKCSNYLMIP